MRGRNVQIIWMPFELRPDPVPTLDPNGAYLRDAWKNSVYPFAARMGVEMKLPQVSPQPRTRLALEGLEFAKAHGAGEAYNTAVMQAFFQRSEDIGEVEVLTVLAAGVGLDADSFRVALHNGTYAAHTAGLLRVATEEMEIHGVPLFLIGDVALSGVQSRETLQQVIDQQLEKATE